MAGIIFTHPPTRQRSSINARLNRRQLLAGSAALASTIALGSSAIAQTPGATPAASPVSNHPAGKLDSLLTLIPAGQAAKAAASGVLFYYADLETQLKSMGIAQDGSFTGENLIAALGPLALASQAFQYALQPEFVDTFGFNAFDTHRSLFAGVPPEDISIFQGGLDRDKLIAAWKASGYKPKKTALGTEFWTAGENGELDLSSPVSQYGAGALNNAVLLDNDTLVFARFARLIEEIVKQAVQGGPSLADQPGVAPVVNTLSDRMVSAIGVTGSFASTEVRVTPAEQKRLTAQMAESDDAVGKMPRVDVIVFGIDAGMTVSMPTDSATPAAVGSPEASPVANLSGSPLVEVRMHTGSDADAAKVAKVVAWRWVHMDSQQTGNPYSGLMKLVSADVSPADPTVAAIDFDPGDAGGRWQRMVNTRDLLPFGS